MSEIVTLKYNTAIGVAYEKFLRRMLKDYYYAVSEDAIDIFMQNNNIAELASKELLARAGIKIEESKNNNNKTAAKFISDIELQASSAFRKAYVSSKKPIPPELYNVGYFSPKTTNLITKQVQKITGLQQYQFELINEALTTAITSNNLKISNFKKALNQIDIHDEKRIRTIAENQLNYSTTIIYNNKALELGLQKAIWKHPPKTAYITHGRPSHIAANGKIFDLEKGCYIDNEYIQPAEKINCLCYCQYVV
jgi:RNase H-fold protein (predicted Holliday junction resolvase)